MFSWAGAGGRIPMGGKLCILNPEQAQHPWSGEQGTMDAGEDGMVNQ